MSIYLLNKPLLAILTLENYICDKNFFIFILKNFSCNNNIVVLKNYIVKYT